MRKKTISTNVLLAVIRMTILTALFYSSAYGDYNPADAISYAETWWDERNSVIYDECDPYQDFDSRGGDCVNFVSQCLIAGGFDLSIHPDAWACGCFSTCTGLNDYLVNILDIESEQRFKVEGVPSWFEAGDVAIFGYNDLHSRTHAVIAVTGHGLSVTCNAHSSDQHQRTIQWFYDFTELYPPTFDRCTFYHIPRSDEPVYFADENLKAAVKKRLGITTDPTATDMLDLTFLTVVTSDIHSLVGLEHAVNLQYLCFLWNQCPNLEPFAGLTNLNSLLLAGNQISSLEPLAGLTNLNSLVLALNQISSLEPLAGLCNLSILNLRDNQISNLKPLAGLTNLNELWLSGNQISNLKPLAGLTNLSNLNLAGNQISNLEPLSGLTNLNSLDLAHNQISNIEPLTGLTNLNILVLAENQITDIGPLRNLTVLVGIMLEHNPLNCEAYRSIIPLFDNNPEIIISYDPMPPECEFLNQIEEILYFVDDSMEGGTLTGDGPGNSGENRLNALVNMLEEAQRLIDAEMFEEAYVQLQAAYERTDGLSPPPDFVTGEAATELAELIHELIEGL